MASGGWERPWAASGALFVALLACGLLFADVLASDNYPALDAAPGPTLRYFRDNVSDVRALSFFHILAALALVVFAAYLRALLRPAGALAALAFAGGVTAAAFLLLSALFYRALAEPVVARDAPLRHALLVLSYLAGGPAIAVPLALPIGAGSLAGLRRALLPAWIGWLGLPAAAASLASAATVLGPASNSTALYGLLLLAAVLALLWVAAASLALARRAGGP